MYLSWEKQFDADTTISCYSLYIMSYRDWGGGVFENEEVKCRGTGKNDLNTLHNMWTRIFLKTEKKKNVRFSKTSGYVWTVKNDFFENGRKKKTPIFQKYPNA